jgi:phosphate transport system permease protein
MNRSGQQTPAQLLRRHRRSRRFKAISGFALILAATFLVWFLVDMIAKGWPAFRQAELLVTVTYDERSASIYTKAVERDIRPLVSRGWLRLVPLEIQDNPALMGTTEQVWVVAQHQVDQYLKGHYHRLSQDERERVDQLREQGRTRLSFNEGFFTNGDSKLPAIAGIKAAVVGSILTLIVTMSFAFPVGVLTAVYLEEFAPDNKLTQAIEVNINNLAAIPSILFGLLGLAIFINFFQMPRSSPLVGGLTLGLMTLPIVIISARAALRSVPDSIRQAAFGVGASRWQVVKDHVLPLAIPGILTGSIIGLAQAMGETAPLIIVGMIAYIPDPPTSFTQAATVLPAQIFTWAGMPERAYVERTAAGILVLLSVLITLNAAAVYLRYKFERRW